MIAFDTLVIQLHKMSFRFSPGKQHFSPYAVLNLSCGIESVRADRHYKLPWHLLGDLPHGSLEEWCLSCEYTHHFQGQCVCINGVPFWFVCVVLRYNTKTELFRSPLFLWRHKLPVWTCGPDPGAEAIGIAASVGLWGAAWQVTWAQSDGISGSQ